MNMHDDDALRWRLRELQSEQQPRIDLWPGIAARLADAPQSPAAMPRRHGARRLAPWALAASLLLALGVGWQMLPGNNRTDVAAHPIAPQQAVSMSLEYENAIARLQQSGTRPELHRALGELDRSAAQILAAIDRDPDATFLLEQLRRTYAWRLQLTQRALIT